MSFGECTITLQDVAVQFRLPVDGRISNEVEAGRGFLAPMRGTYPHPRQGNGPRGEPIPRFPSAWESNKKWERASESVRESECEGEIESVWESKREQERECERERER